MWINSKAMPSKRHMQPTTMYAMPRNGFFPPRSDVVLKIIRFEPSKAETSYTKKNCVKYASTILENAVYYCSPRAVRIRLVLNRPGIGPGYGRFFGTTS